MPKKTAKYYDIISNKENKTAEVLIYGVIGESWWEESTTAKQFVKEFRNLEKDHDIINIRLNSPGGSVFDGLAIYNAISSSNKDVHTYNDGVCASMAAVILLAVDMDNVHPANNSLLMLHSPSTGAWGNRNDLENALNVLDKVQKVLVKSICDKTGLDEKEVEEKYFDYKDHWFTADEAKEEGMYTNIDERNVESIPENAQRMKFSDLVKYFEPTNSIFPPFINKVAPSKPDNSTIIDMDIQLLRDAYGLDKDKYPEDKDVLDYIKKREQEYKDLETAKTKAETDLETANKSIEEKDAEIEDLRNEPGADPADVTPSTDPKGGDDPKSEDKPAESFGEAFGECMSILKPKQ